MALQKYSDVVLFGDCEEEGYLCNSLDLDVLSIGGTVVLSQDHTVVAPERSQ